MIKRTYLSISLLMVMSQINFSQTVHYLKLYGNKGYEDVRSLVSFDNGEIAFTGLDKTAMDSTGDVYLSRLNPQGELIKKLYFGKPKEDGGNGLIRTSDGGLLILGHTALPNFGIECDALVTKLNALDQIEWQATIGGGLDETCYHAVEMPDSSFWIAGTLHDEIKYKYIGLIFHLNKSGKLIGTDTLLQAGKYNKTLSRIFIDQDKNLLVGGNTPTYYWVTNDNDGYSSGIVIAGFNPNFENNSTPLFQNYYESASLNKLNDLIELKDHNGYLIIGNSGYYTIYNKPDSSYQPKPYLYKTLNNRFYDPSFKNPFEKFGYGSISKGALAKDGRIYLVGELVDSNKISNAFWAVLNSELQIEKWAKIDLSHSTASCLALGTNNDFFMGGVQTLKGESQIYLAHISPFEITSTIDEINTNEKYVYPNPCSNSINFEYGKEGESFYLQVFGVDGKQLLHKEVKGKQTTVSLYGWPNGTFFYKLRDKKTGQMASGKFLKETK